MNAFSVPHVLANGFRCGCWLLVSWSGGAAVGLAQDGQLVLGREPSPLGLLRNLGIWWAGHAPRINPGPGCRHRHGHEQKCSLSPSVNGRAEVSQLMLEGRSPNSTPLHNHESRVIRNTLETTQSGIRQSPLVRSFV